MHTAPWPVQAELSASGSGASESGTLESGAVDLPSGLLAAVSEALVGTRRAQTDAKASMKTPVASAAITGPRVLEQALDDLAAAGRIERIDFAEGPEVVVSDVVLAEEPIERSSGEQSPVE